MRSWSCVDFDSEGVQAIRAVLKCARHTITTSDYPDICECSILASYILNRSDRTVPVSAGTISSGLGLTLSHSDSAR